MQKTPVSAATICLYWTPLRYVLEYEETYSFVCEVLSTDVNINF